MTSESAVFFAKPVVFGLSTFFDDKIPSAGVDSIVILVIGAELSFFRGFAVAPAGPAGLPSVYDANFDCSALAGPNTLVSMAPIPPASACLIHFNISFVSSFLVPIRPTANLLIISCSNKPEPLFASQCSYTNLTMDSTVTTRHGTAESKELSIQQFCFWFHVNLSMVSLPRTFCRLGGNLFPPMVKCSTKRAVSISCLEKMSHSSLTLLYIDAFMFIRIVNEQG
jgi:hypothetical protein